MEESWCRFTWQQIYLFPDITICVDVHRRLCPLALNKCLKWLMSAWKMINILLREHYFKLLIYLCAPTANFGPILKTEQKYCHFADNSFRLNCLETICLTFHEKISCKDNTTFVPMIQSKLQRQYIPDSHGCQHTFQRLTNSTKGH